MISFSEISDADPKSQTLSTVLFSLTYKIIMSWKVNKRAEILTRILSGLTSACMMLHLRNRLSARNSWLVYARTARIFNPTSLPNRLITSRRFMLLES